jgi:hypothetical protein
LFETPDAEPTPSLPKCRFSFAANNLSLYQRERTVILRLHMRSSLGVDYGTNSVRALIVDYRAMHDALGGVNKTADLSRVMKELIAIKENQNK